jgi:hypothetical protein
MARAQSIYGADSVPARPTPDLLSLDPITGIEAGSDLVQVCIAALGDLLTSA